MTKILHIPNFYPPHTGGIEDVCHNIVHILQKAGNYEQRIICFSGTNESVDDVYENIPVTRVGAALKVSSQSLSIKYYFKLRNIIHQFNPDVIHYHHPNPLVAAYLLCSIPKHCKLIVHWHSDIVDQTTLYKFVKTVENGILKRADTIITTSPNYLKGSKPLQPHINKSVVIANIIDSTKFIFTPEVKKKVEEIRQTWGGKKIVLYVGRHVPYKGLKYLIEAAPMIKSECVFLIGGSGPLTESLKKSNTDARVHFIGRIDDAELASYYYAASVFAFPSITKNEAFGVALAEAMYCNTPAVTFGIEGSGVNWVNIDGETGLTAKNCDSKEFAASVEKILCNDDLQKLYAENAHQRVCNTFVEERITSQIIQLYQ